jgi:hypothetical protein
MDRGRLSIQKQNASPKMPFWRENSFFRLYKNSKNVQKYRKYSLKVEKGTREW